MSMPAENLITAPTVADLLRGYVDAPALPVTGIASDSRQVADGYLFLATQGMTSHGLDFIDKALASGAVAIAFDAASADAPDNVNVPVLAVDDLAAKLGEIANRFYGRPSERLKVMGVTGTNGKTTVAWLIAQCEELLGASCGYLGTLGYGVGELAGAGGMTTPAAVELHGRLAEFCNQHASSAAIEVSSHALSQGRVDGVRFEAALFTNLTRDHLDYHADMRQYFESKARLFEEADVLHRIVAIDSEWGVELASRCGDDVVVVATQADRVGGGSFDSRPHVFVRAVDAKEQGSEFVVDSSWGRGRVKLPLPGEFNVANAALVLATLLQRGVDFDTARDVLSQVTAPPGRMQRVAADGVNVYIDFAHTPEAIDVSLTALRAHCSGKLVCVFGCGGERDAGKRPLMGRAAEQRADTVVITSDNPRNELPQKIIAEIVGGLQQPEHAVVIEDRAAAIGWAIGQAQAGDVVLLAGKGHETYQQVGDARLPFSDLLVAQTALGIPLPGGAS